MFVRTEAEFQRVMALVGEGLSDRAISQATGIPRSTVLNWRRKPRLRMPPAPVPVNWRPPEEDAYCYVLGLYLGDGHVATTRSPFLTVSMDAAYPGLIAEAAEALAKTFPSATVRRYPKAGRRLVVLQVSGRVMLAAFPQHGAGKKHERPIVLEPWQRDLTARHPELLVRGLIHSDGCRAVNRFKTKLPSGRLAEYQYVRYFFSNLSADIRRIFCEHCEMLGIRWTQSNHRNISISHRDSVAIMERIVGPKA